MSLTALKADELVALAATSRRSTDSSFSASDDDLFCTPASLSCVAHARLHRFHRVAVLIINQLAPSLSF